MKVKIVKMAEGADVSRPPKGSLKDWFERLKDSGYDGPMKVGKMQKWMVDNHPEDVLRYMRQNPPERNTNKGRNTYKKDFSDYTDQEVLDAFNDDLWDYRNPTPGSSVNDKFDFTGKRINPYNTDIQKGYYPGNDYDYKDPDTSKKDPYKKRSLPLYQIAPELMGIAESFQPFDYQTPDFTHWEINPSTLNIQPQINDINSSLKGVYDSTTGSPQVDNIRRQAAFVAGMDAKQRAFSAKQNFDANARFQADSLNIGARTTEQNADVNAWTNVRNNLLSMAKDFAAGERISALSSIANKKALNTKNETEKAYYYDNFAPNVEENDYQLKGTGNPMFDMNYYTQEMDGGIKPINSRVPIPQIEAEPAKITKPKNIINDAAEADLPSMYDWGMEETPTFKFRGGGMNKNIFGY